jgi:hypothetical protein
MAGSVIRPRRSSTSCVRRRSSWPRELVGRGGVQAARGDRADVLPVAEGVRRAEDGPGEEAQGAGAENARLKRLLADAELDKAMLRRRRRETSEPARGSGTPVLVRPVRVSASVGRAGAGDSRGRRSGTRRWSGTTRTPLTRRIIELAATYGRYGYRRITAMLRGEGWRVNHKRVERIWRREG